MRLYELLKGIKIIESNADLNMEIDGIASDSRKIKKDFMFVGIKGEQRDGNSYINGAISNGASVILSEVACDRHIPSIKVENVRKALSQLWNNFYLEPTKDMKITAITGTNGKTSTAYFLYSILKESGERCGLISTIKCLICDKEYDTMGGSDIQDINAAMTTPDPEILFRIFAEMRNQNVKYVVMEASSHALFFDKLEGVNIHTGVFLNLSPEHLDFHKNIDEYFNAKKKLFALCKNGVINIDDEHGNMLAKELPNSARFSAREKSNYYANKVKIYDTGCKFFLKYGKNKIGLKSNILGSFVPYNASCAAVVALLLNVDKRAIKQGIKNCRSIEGRMQKVRKNIFIDFAHTPIAMKNVLLFFKEACKSKRIKVLFGCGGDRDKSKRKIMGNIASMYANEVYLTSDNSRNENPDEIIKEIKEGVLSGSVCYEIPDRREAIIKAVRELKPNEILILLGKGHELYEIKNNQKTYFSEQKIIEEALLNDKNPRAIR